MTFEDFVIGHALLQRLADKAIEHLLDLMEDPTYDLPFELKEALHGFLRMPEAEYGNDYPAVVQVSGLLF